MIPRTLGGQQNTQSAGKKRIRGPFKNDCANSNHPWARDLSAGFCVKPRGGEKRKKTQKKFKVWGAKRQENPGRRGHRDGAKVVTALSRMWATEFRIKPLAPMLRMYKGGASGKGERALS